MTPAAAQNLDRRLVQGIAWTGAVRWATQILSWAATFVVARLLTPTDYGLVGMAMIYVGLAQIVSEGGVCAAIVQQRDLNDEQVAELNGLAIMIGIVLFVVTLALAAPISWFFGEPQVYPVVLVLSSVFLIRGLQVVPRALLARDLDFRRLAWVDGLETVVLMAVTVLMALANFGYWSLAVGGIASSLFTTALSRKWRPHAIAFPRSITRVKRPVNFAWQVVTSQVAWYSYSNADFAVVGRMLGKAILGAYSFAWTIASIPVDRVSGMVSRVTPAFFAAVQHDPPALRRYLLNLTEGLAFATLPACIGLAVVAPEFVEVFLGHAWVAAIVPLRLLALYAAFRSIITPAPQILIAMGHSRQSMYFSLLAALVLPPAFVIGARWGAPGVAMVWILVYPVIAIGLFLRYAFRLIGMSMGQYLRALLPASLATAAMAAVVLVVRQLLPAGEPALPRLLIEVFAGAAVYCTIVYLVHGDRLRAVQTLLRGSREAASGNLVHDSGPSTSTDRLLLITYHFPPGTAIGALRWQKLTRHAAERGWGVDVICLDPAHLQRPDPTALADLPPGVRVYGIAPSQLRLDRIVSAMWDATKGVRDMKQKIVASPVRAASRACKELSWWPRERRDLSRAYFAIVEHLEHLRWGRDAARVALRIHDPQRHRAVITCGPPHPVHEAGVMVSQKTRLPLVVDMRDPWSLVQRLPEAIASRTGLLLARRAERRAVEAAALVVANTHALRNAMRQMYPGAASRIIAVPNGYDEDPVPVARPQRRFTIAYAGTVYLDRDPRGLLRAAAQLVRDLDLTPAELSLEFMGEARTFDGVALEDMARAEGVGDFLTVHPKGSRAEALEFLARGTMLVVLPQDSDMAIPAKIFDYARFDAWVLVLAERGSATDLLLQGTSADLVRPADAGGLLETLRTRYLQHVRGESGTRLSKDDRLSRKRQAAILFDALEGIVGAPSRPRTEEPATVPSLSRVAL